MKRLTQISSRNIFIIFLVLTGLFLAQMTWWIIFQVREADRTRKFFEATVRDERRWAAELLNARYREIYDAAAAMALELDGRPPEQKSYRDPAISGIAVETGSGISGLEDSVYFAFPSGNNRFLVFLTRDYPAWVVMANKHLSFVSPGSGEITNPEWVTAESFQIDDSAMRAILSQRDRHIKMFVMEGSFFIALIMLGAYAIYLGLARSRRVRQEQLLFVHSVTHELKIPLTSIGLFLDTMKRRGYESKIVSELAPKMKEDLGRLSGLIDNILMVRKLADKEIETKLTVLDLSTELDRFASDIRERIESSGGKLSIEIDKGIKVKVDPADLVKIWETVVDNAVKYRRESGFAMTIGLRRTDGQAETRFLDNGPGIPAGMENELFEPFVRGRGDAKKSIPGSGLGLYIAREQVKRNRGSISIKNAPSGGCLVTIKFKAIA